MHPPRSCARRLASHQPAADDADADDPLNTALQQPESLGGADALVHDRHERLRHRRGPLVLDDVASVDDPGGAVPEHGLRAAQDLLVGSPPAAPHEEWYGTGGLGHPPVLVELVRRVGLDHVRAELGGLAHEGHDRVRVPVHAIAGLAGFHRERLDHERHADRVTGRSQLRDVAYALPVEVGLAGGRAG